MFTFWLRKILGQLLMPLSLSLTLLVSGLIMLWCTRRQRGGKILVTLGTVWLFLNGNPIIADFLLKPLEGRRPPGQQVEAAGKAAVPRPVDLQWVVVLGGGVIADPGLEPLSQLSYASLARLVGGIEIYRQMPGTRLLLSGGQVFGPVAEAEIMGRMAQRLGVGAQDLVLETASQDTEAQARIIKALVGEKKFLLITSAAHMPRSLAFFHKQGLQPLPYPVDYQVKENPQRHPGRWFPGSSGLRRSETACYEYLGMAWGKLRGKL
jgi:uncharacterized SAM-binding protein YcdF (DUF218 family)